MNWVACPIEASDAEAFMDSKPERLKVEHVPAPGRKTGELAA